MRGREYTFKKFFNHPDFEEWDKLIADGTSPQTIAEMSRNRYPTDRKLQLNHSYLYKYRQKHYPHLARGGSRRKKVLKLKPTEEGVVEDDLSSRIMVLTNREPPPPEPRRYISDEKLLSWVEGINGFSKFVNDMIIERGEHVELQDYQVEMAEAFLNHTRVTVCAGGQIGKDLMIRTFSTWLALMNPGSSQLILCSTQSQSTEIMERTLDMMAVDTELEATKLAEARKPEHIIYFKNGSRIYYLTAKSRIAGKTNILCIWVNEARYIREEEVTRVSPLLGIAGGKLYVLSRPMFRRGYFWTIYQECERNPRFKSMQIPSLRNKYFDRQVYEDDRATISPTLFKAEYLAEFADAGSSYFSEKAINECSRTDYDCKAMVPEEDYVYSLGIDPARLHDTSAMVVVGQHKNPNRRPRYKVAHVWGFNPDLAEPSTFAHQYAYVGLLNSRFGFEHIVPEKTGMGGPYSESLKTRWVESGWSPLVIEPYDNSGISQKLSLYDFCKQIIEIGDIEMPRSARQLIIELKMTQFGASPTGKPRVETPITDDYSDALCLALIAFKKPFEIGVATVKLPGVHLPILRR